MGQRALTLGDMLGLVTPRAPEVAGPNRPYVAPERSRLQKTLGDFLMGGVDVFMGALGLPGGPESKARLAGELLAAAPLGTLRSMAKMLTKEQMLARGADGHLSRAFEAHIPIDKLDGLEPVPANVDTPDGKYAPGRQITQPIEVVHDAATDKYMVYAGNHRIAQARANGDKTIPAFVEPDSTKRR